MKIISLIFIFMFYMGIADASLEVGYNNPDAPQVNILYPSISTNETGGSCYCSYNASWDYNQTSAGNGFFLNLSGTNANQNIDIGNFNFTTNQSILPKNIVFSNVSIIGNQTGIYFMGSPPYNNSVYFDLMSSSSGLYIRKMGSASSINWEAWEFGIGNTRIMDDKNLYRGTGYDVWERWSTVGNDSLQLGLKLNSTDHSGYFSIMEQADMGKTNRSPMTITPNPTLRIYSRDENQSADYIEFFHDTDNANLKWGNGDLMINSLYGGGRTIDLGYTSNDVAKSKSITSDKFLCGLGGYAESFTCNLPTRDDTMNYVCMDENYNEYQSPDECNLPPP